MSVVAPSQRIHLLPGTKRGPETVWADYNEIDVADNVDERKAKLEQWMAMRVGSELMKHYNQREWKVMVDLEGELLIIACDSICNFKGYHIKMHKRTIGELIERAIMAQGRWRSVAIVRYREAAGELKAIPLRLVVRVVKSSLRKVRRAG